MKVCLISNLYFPHERGGAERIVRSVALNLQSKGHRVVVVSTQPKDVNGFKPTTEVENGMLVYRFYPRNFFWYKDDYKHPKWERFFWHIFDTFNIFSAITIYRILSQERPDVVWTHNLKGIGFLIPRVIKFLKIKHWHTLHDVQLANPSGLIIWGEEGNWKNNNFFIKVYSWICAWLFAKVDKVISPSQWLANFYQTRGFFKNSQILVLPNPVSFDRVDFHVKKHEGINALYLGQIEKHKGILWLIDWWRDHLNLEVNLLIAGGGSKMIEAQEKAQGDDRIEFLGLVERYQLPEVFSRTDLMIFPSLCYENSPGAIYESLFFATPVLASRIGGVPELIEEGRTGWTFEPGNSQEFKEKLDLALENLKSIYFSHLSNSAKEFALDNYLEKLGL